MSTKAVDQTIDALWSAFKAEIGATITARDIRIAVENTGGGCEALVIRTPAGVMAVGEDDFDEMNSALYAWHEGNAFDDGEESTALLSNSSPRAVVGFIAEKLAATGPVLEDWQVALRDTGIPADIAAMLTADRVTDLDSDDTLSQVTVQIDPRSVLILTGAEQTLWSALYVEGGEAQMLPLIGRLAAIRDLIAGK